MILYDVMAFELVLLFLLFHAIIITSEWIKNSPAGSSTSSTYQASFWTSSTNIILLENIGSIGTTPSKIHRSFDAVSNIF